MPRLATSLILHARSIHPYLISILRTTRTLPSAIRELRWLREHVASLSLPPASARFRLHNICRDRERGKPLQYILGTAYFGDLEIKCAKDVLIPRWETAAAVIELVKRSDELDIGRSRLGNGKDQITVLDLCTGSGCSALLAHHEFIARGIRTQILGVDISQQAIDLARQNRRRLFPSGSRKSVIFARADVLNGGIQNSHEHPPSINALLQRKHRLRWDIVMANPPYVSPQSYEDGTTSRSVRLFEPKLALVPPERSHDGAVRREDAFYPQVLATACKAKAKILLMEVADLTQAIRVVHMAFSEGYGWERVEIWRDEPDQACSEKVEVDQIDVDIIGIGNARSVVCWKTSKSLF